MKEEEAKKIINDLRRDYNLVSSSFARSRDRMWPEVKFLFDYVKEGEVVLDLGCGNGRFSSYLEKTKYVGIDFSKGMIKEAEKRFPEKKFLTGDAFNLPFEENYFDKVYSIAVIHQIPSHKYRLQALFEIKRVLKKGGMVFLTAWKMSKEEKNLCIETPFSDQDICLKRKRYYYLFQEKELSLLLEEAGFVVYKEGVVMEDKRNNYFVIAKKN
jgi:alkylated DNA repair protein alkB homolog 8